MLMLCVTYMCDCYVMIFTMQETLITQPRTEKKVAQLWSDLLDRLGTEALN